MVRMILKSGLAVACLFAISVFVPRANAGSVDFSCGANSTPCTGTVTSSSSGGFTTSGIGLQSSISSEGTETFMATFTTDSIGVGSISISDSDGDSLSGDIVATTPSSFGDDQTLTFNVNWTSVSSNIQAALGSNSGVGQSTVVFSISNGVVSNASLHLSSSGSGPHSPTPEPSTLLLLGTGLLGVGLAFRRYSLA